MWACSVCSCFTVKVNEVVKCSPFDLYKMFIRWEFTFGVHWCIYRKSRLPKDCGVEFRMRFNGFRKKLKEKKCNNVCKWNFWLYRHQYWNMINHTSFLYVCSPAFQVKGPWVFYMLRQTVVCACVQAWGFSSYALTFERKVKSTSGKKFMYRTHMRRPVRVLTSTHTHKHTRASQFNLCINFIHQSSVSYHEYCMIKYIFDF